MGATTESIYSIYTKGSKRVTTDSRAVTNGDLFVALRGDNFDGNLFAETALKSGAMAVVVDSRFAQSEAGAACVGDSRYIIVEDTLEALQKLANHHRRALGIEIIALTGSNGKTTTKELIIRTLAVKYRVSATRGNLNNHIGVPLTLLSFTSDIQIGIVEMGANHLHEIESLCCIAQPNCGLITNVGRAHLEGFGGTQGVRQGKGEMFDHLASSGGVAIYPTHDNTISDMIEERSLMGLKAEGYSLSDYDLSICDSSEQTLCVQSHDTKYHTALVGDYNINNIAAALAVGRHYGVDIEDALPAMTQYSPDNNRSQVVVREGNTLYMDAYNANPSSMEAALANFDSLEVSPKALIIGDMRELGNYSAAEHRALLERIAAMDRIETVILVGEHLTKALDAVRDRFTKITDLHNFTTVSHAADYLAQHPIRDSHILVKGSRGIALEKLF